MDLNDRVAWITGSGGGIGRATALRFAAAGARVAASDVNHAGVAETVELIRAAGGTAEAFVGDVASAESVDSIVDGVLGAWGRLDVLVNNAGVGAPKNQRLGSLDYAAWARVLDANTMGPMRVVEAFLDNVAAGGERKIVTLTSAMGSIADNASGGSYAYRSSKAAVNIVMKSLSIDLAPRGITCVVVHPGWVRTDMGGPGGKLDPPESVAALRRLIAGIRPQDTGRFFNYDGKPYPW